MSMRLDASATPERSDDRRCERCPRRSTGPTASTPSSGASSPRCNAYQRALRSAEGRATVDAAEILRFASEHQRTVAALQVAVREMGGVPASEAATSGAFALLRDTATVRELLDGEEAGPADVRGGDGKSRQATPATS